MRYLLDKAAGGWVGLSEISAHGDYAYVVDKVEGFAIDAVGNGFVVTDNDGVDDSSGETYFFSIGAM